MGFKKVFAVILSVALVFSGIMLNNTSTQATVTNVANGRNSTTYMTSNANTPVEGFLYIGNGFSQINVCNENYGNGNNLLGKTATTEESAIYVDLGARYDIDTLKLYQGSTNTRFYDSYCKSFKVYYSTEQVNKTNQGKITWTYAGSCTNGTIYKGSSIKINKAEDISETGDIVDFDQVGKNAKSVKVVFDKEACQGTGSSTGTGTLGTVSVVSL